MRWYILQLCEAGPEIAKGLLMESGRYSNMRAEWSVTNNLQCENGDRDLHRGTEVAVWCLCD